MIIDYCLAKAKLKILGVSTTELSKPKPISQGTQSDFKEPEKEKEKEKESTDIVVIEESEEDKAVRALLRSENLTLPTQQQPIDSGNTNPFTFSAPQAITLNAQERIVITPQNTTLGVVTSQNTSVGIVTPQNAGLLAQHGGVLGAGVTGQNVTQSFITPHNVTPGSVTGQNISLGGITGQNVTPGSVTGQNISLGGVTGQNVAGRNVTGQNVAQEIILDAETNEYTPVFPQGVIGVPAPGASTSSDQTQLSIAQGFKRTKFEDTLELIDLKPVQGCKDKKLQNGFSVLAA